MAGEVVTVYAGERPPQYWDASVLMASPGPPPSDPDDAGSWPGAAIALLREQWNIEGRLVVFVSEFHADPDRFTGRNADWMSYVLHSADVVMFWLPEGAAPLLSLADIAWGALNDSQRVVMGASRNVPEARVALEYADDHNVPIATTLTEAVDKVLGKIGLGARRSGGERGVPLPIWRSRSFRNWYDSQSAAGNTMLSARQVWTFSAGSDNQLLLYWALHVSMHIAAEDRVKSNEVVISRPDISVMALYKRGASLDDTIIVLIREFRSPASTPDGFVHELPGGSAPGDVLHQAVIEVSEETGLAIDVTRIRAYGSRQVAATLSAHHAHLFAAQITDDELARLGATQSRARDADDTERTWTEITTFGEIRRKRLADWATIGMITEVLLATTSPGGAAPTC